ncbi:hypothetical protein Bbelb_029240 [Branchiostoma belcheri]|nr:hypothetical protein Bbelb_029240 [Branchiostoma belcheri]
MPKRKRNVKPIDGQGTISAFIVASLAVTTARVAEDEPAAKRHSGRGASSEQRSTISSTAGGTATVSRAESTLNTGSTGTSERITANKDDITKKAAKRKAMFKRVQTTVAVVRGMREGIRSGTRLSKLEQDLSAGGRLEAFSISVSSERKLKWQRDVREPFIDQLLTNLEERFHSTELLSSFAVLDPSLMPQPMPEEYGCAKVQCLAAQYGGEVRGIVDSDALCDKWWGLREYIAQNRHLSQEQLVKLLLTDATMAELYPSMKLLASVLMVIPVSTADSERAFSTLKRVKTRLRSSLKNETLNQLLTISIDGPDVDSFDFEAAAMTWGQMKNRRISV